MSKVVRKKLPPPSQEGRVALERAISSRRSVREYTDQPLTDEELSRLLWSLQGITARDGSRAAPSAGALYPLEIYIIMGDGLYHYEPRRHELRCLSDQDLRRPVCVASLRQESVLQAAAVFVIAAVFQRIERTYGKERGPQYVYMEVGHAAQNLMLQATALGLGSVPIGAFEDEKIARILGLPADHEPLYLVPVGTPRRGR
jgi:SagB-type dehydrogenase family enzyme